MINLRVLAGAVLGAAVAFTVTSCTSGPTFDECVDLGAAHSERFVNGETTQDVFSYLDEVGCGDVLRDAFVTPAVEPVPVPDHTCFSDVDGVVVCEGEVPASVGEYVTPEQHRQMAEQVPDPTAEQLGAECASGMYLGPDGYCHVDTDTDTDTDTDVQEQRGSDGGAALDACVEQTGMTRDECRADAAGGNAS